LKARWDYQNTIDFAREEGEENKAREIARRMLEDGDSIERVIRITGLTEEQIQAL
jgi:predicted transposase YdaD